MKKVLMIISGGGFYFQSLSLLKKIDKDCIIEIAIPSDSKSLIHNIKQNLNKSYKYSFLPPLTTFSSTFLSKVYQLIKSVVIACQILRNSKPDAIVVVASSLSVPVFMVAKLFQVKTIYIDSITRVNEASFTGKIVSKFHLSDRFYVQWPEAVSMYRNAIYMGTVL